MKFKSVTIENFGVLSEAHVDLDERGLVLVQGDNQHNSSAESNGAGKSTVFEAICWCLYGKTAKGQTGDAVIRREIGKNCVVHVEMEDGDVTYQVTRGRKHKSFSSKLHIKMMKDGKTTALTKGTDKLTQEVSEQILGCSYEVFIGAVYSGQERMPDLPSMTDSKLKVLIEEAAGITVLDEAYKIARTELAEAVQQYDRQQSRVEAVEAVRLRADDRYQDAKTSKGRWDAERDARIIDMETRTRILLRDAKSAQKQLEGLKSEETIETERRLNKNKMDRHHKETEKLEELVSAHQKAERNALSIKTAAEGVKRIAIRAREELKELKDHIGKPCTSCKRPHTEESLAKAIVAKKVEIAELLQQTKQEIERYKKAFSEAQTASENAEAFKRSMTDLSEAIALSEQLSAQLAKVNEVKSAYKSALQRAKDATQAIKDEREKENPYIEDIDQRKIEASNCRNDVNIATKALEPLEKAVKVAESVVKVYSPKGVRAHILDTVTPYLNERTAHYLGALTDGELEAVWQTITLTAKGEARENFKIEVTGDDGKGNFLDLSGGEKRKVRIACALALQDLVATRASKSLDLFIADEIDDALDPSGLERLMGILDEKAKERGSVFIISHSDLRDWVSNVMTVEKSEGASKVIA